MMPLPSRRRRAAETFGTVGGLMRICRISLSLLFHDGLESRSAGDLNATFASDFFPFERR